VPINCPSCSAALLGASLDIGDGDGESYAQCPGCGCISRTTTATAEIVGPCDRCGEIVPESEALGDGDDYLCPDCPSGR
jgi:uncharacterized C2H2 Zn-finger protein